MRQISKILFLFAVGGATYYSIELVCRGRSHPSMFLLGGICFILCGGLNELFPENIPLWQQMFACSLMITLLELIFGYIINIRLNLNVWDYSRQPLNFKGQICLLFSVIWFFLGGVAIVADDVLRHVLYQENKVRYNLGLKAFFHHQ